MFRGDRVGDWHARYDLTAAALSRLVQAGQLSWDTAAFRFVGVDSALPVGAAATPSMDEITVQQLVLRASHLPRDFDREQREIAGRLGIGTAPIPRRLLLRYLYGLPPVDAIPPGGLYSNIAFFLLTSVVEQARLPPMTMPTCTPRNWTSPR